MARKKAGADLATGMDKGIDRMDKIPLFALQDTTEIRQLEAELRRIGKTETIGHLEGCVP